MTRFDEGRGNIPAAIAIETLGILRRIKAACSLEATPEAESPVGRETPSELAACFSAAPWRARQIGTRPAPTSLSSRAN